MGVPKFFRWCAERYPSVITPFKDTPPPVDNLYLDMNGIIHHCSHPNDIDATQRAPTEKDMMQAMFVYLEKLFNAIQPKKYFVLAVDGVAPRAKMNQQRQRRYRSAYEMLVAREEAAAQGLDLPDEKDVFDSNCITPGTPFMIRVSTEFQYFLTMKLSTDPAWQNCQVIFSGHDCPGEGEHKLVDFIRRRKMQPGYDPNETHCMYGLDADLIMLALATHEPHFVLLREVVTFGASTFKERQRQEENEAKGLVENKAYHKADEFVLFHISVLRDYLQIDISEKLRKLGGFTTFNFERVIDDFIFMCFFVGNDFLPSIPTVGINDGSVQTMMQIYVEVALSQGRYLTNQGKVDWRVSELWISRLGELELETIRTRQVEEENYQRNRARRNQGHETGATLSAPVTSITQYKERFYREKHKFANGWDPTGPEMRAMILHYLEGLTWVIGYYYQGVQSWQWYYPHYYAPMASDLANLPAIAAQIHFNKGNPFLPHQQLLAVLPPMSYRSIPAAYWPLMRSKSSPLNKYYPEHIEIDREGARADWEGIVIIPFMKEEELLVAYESVQKDVSEEDARNNRLGPSLHFFYDEKMEPTTLNDDMFGPLHNVLVKREPFAFPAIDHFVPELCNGVLINDRQLEGFSTLQSKRMLINPTFEQGEVSVFGAPTKRESLILNLQSFDNSMSRAEKALVLLGKEVLVAFPHYKRAKVAILSDESVTLHATYSSSGVLTGYDRKVKNRDEKENFARETETHRKYMKAKLGIAVTKVDVLVYVQRFTGMQVTKDGFLQRNFASNETCYPLQLICPLELIHMRPDSRYEERPRDAADTKVGARCVFIGSNLRHSQQQQQRLEQAGVPFLFGSVGFVISAQINKSAIGNIDSVVGANDTSNNNVLNRFLNKNNNINNNSNSNNNGSNKNKLLFTLQLHTYAEPFQLPAPLIEYAARDNWVALHELADRMRVRPSTLSTICGSMETTAQYGSREIGLCIKLTSRSLARVGYAKLVQRSHNPWYLGIDFFARMEEEATDLSHHLAKTDKSDYLGHSRMLGQQYTNSVNRNYNNNTNNLTSFSSSSANAGLASSHNTTNNNLVNNDRGSVNYSNYQLSNTDSFAGAAVVPPQNNGVWYFSHDGVRVIMHYINSFRPLVDRIEAGGVNVRQVEIVEALNKEWADRAAEDVIEEITSYLDETNIMKLPMIAATEDAYPPEHLEMLEETISTSPRPHMKRLDITSITRSQLYFPVTHSVGGHLVPLPLPLSQSFYLGARVVNCRAAGAVPFGARGTIVRLLASGREAEVVYDTPFIGGTRLDGRLRENRGAITKFSVLLVLPQYASSSSSSALQTATNTKRSKANLTNSASITKNNKTDAVSLLAESRSTVIHTGTTHPSSSAQQSKPFLADDPTHILSNLSTDRVGNMLESIRRQQEEQQNTAIERKLKAQMSPVASSITSPAGVGVNTQATAATAHLSSSLSSPATNTTGTALNITVKNNSQGGIQVGELFDKLAKLTPASLNVQTNQTLPTHPPSIITNTNTTNSSSTTTNSNTMNNNANKIINSNTINDDNKNDNSGRGKREVVKEKTNTTTTTSDNKNITTSKESKQGASKTSKTSTTTGKERVSSKNDANSTRLRHIPRAIPETFLSGQLRIEYNDAGNTFVKWVERLTKRHLQELDDEELIDKEHSVLIQNSSLH